LDEGFFEDLDKEIRKTFRALEDEIARLINEAEMSTGCLEPLTRIAETVDEVIVSFDLPGVRKEDIRVTGTERALVVEARCAVKRVWSHSRSLRREFGKFRKTVDLPAKVDVRSAKATYRNGILEIRLKKVEEGEQIPIL
jgi:HSP20 family protein